MIEEYLYMYMISSVALSLVLCRYYGRKCLSHLLTAADFERVASRTLTSQQWSKLRDAIETLRVKVQLACMHVHMYTEVKAP